LRDQAHGLRPWQITIGGSLNMFACQIRHIAAAVGPLLLFVAAHLCGMIAGARGPTRGTATFVPTHAQEFEKLERLRQQAEAGEITPRVAEAYPPERAAAPHRRLEAGGTRGRLVILF